MSDYGVGMRSVSRTNYMCVVPKSCVRLIPDIVFHIAQMPQYGVCVVDECLILVDRCSACVACSVEQ